MDSKKDAPTSADAADIPQRPSSTLEIAKIIEKKVGEVRVDALDISFGELLSIHESGELIIQPEYQRLFRWSEEKQSRLIESIVLGLPIPQLFVVEDSEGRYELIDGLQRVSSVIHFVDPNLFKVNGTEIASAESTAVGGKEQGDDDEDEPVDTESSVNDKPLRLSGCDIVADLNGFTFEDLPLKHRLGIKRASVRMTIIKHQSNSALRYQMFKRLNTGGSQLSEQEIRNATVRIMGEEGVSFYAFIVHCSRFPAFRRTIQTLSEAERGRKQDEELVLRFFALKNSIDRFKNNISDFITDYLEDVTIKRFLPFDFAKEETDFVRTFTLLNESLGTQAFLRNRDGRFIGSVAPTFYEGMTIGVYRHLDELEKVDQEALRESLTAVRQTRTFLKNTGPGANTRPKLLGRIGAVEDAIAKIIA